ncbi:hypothetical protein QFC22_002506 [Naganishia vaughanmartiniae]|uniref:Uncharacterized protein n=1 Tax=Naganishia vaughanmartiniae TaxID=1424756 RepID=A0ACC2X9I6_9TREE|nr:hypothetical protein QFC22_002506 [Naganishia vaughanmartiniae]
MPFTVASVDAYDLFDTRAPHAFVHAEASVLEHLQRQAQVEALRAREREIERQRRLAHIAALEEAQHRQYHQQAVIDAYLQAQARARAQAEAERQQRERQREYQERVKAIARAQAIQRERAERAHMEEIERRRAQARQRIFVDELFESIFSDVPRVEAPRQPQAQPRLVPPQVQSRVAPPQVHAPPRVPQALVPPQVASHAALHSAQPKHVPPQIQQRQVRPQTIQPPVQQVQGRPAISPAASPAPTSEQEAFFGVSAPQFARAPVPAAARQPAATSPVVKARPEAKKSDEFSQPRQVPQTVKPPQITQPKPSAPNTSTPRALQQSVPGPEPQQSDDLTNLLSTVFGVPFVRRVDEENPSPVPTAEKLAEKETAVSSPPVNEEMTPAPPVIERPPSPAPPDDVRSRLKNESVEPEEVSEDFKRMVDKVFKDLENAFGVPAEVHEEAEQTVAEGKKPEPIPVAEEPAPSRKEAPIQPQVPSSVESPAPAATPSAPPAPIPQDTAPEPKDQPIENLPSEESSADTASATTTFEDDDVPASAADLQSDKAKNAANLIQQKYRRHLARVQRLEKLEALKAKLAKLESGFTFPEHIDFQDPDSGLTTPSLDPVDGASHDGDERVVPVPPLAFTHNNAPYHRHAQALLALLVAADAISSDGDPEVRKVRKEFVKEVEEQLAEMERQRSDVWKKKQAEKGDGKAQQDSHAATRDVDMEGKDSQETAPVSTDAQGEFDAKMGSPSTEYVEPETPKAAEAQSTLETPVDTSMTEGEPVESSTPAQDTLVEPILEKEVLGIDPDVLTAPESEFIKPESSTEKEEIDVASDNKSSEPEGKPGDTKVSTTATQEDSDAKKTASTAKRPPKPAVEDASDVESSIFDRF